MREKVSSLNDKPVSPRDCSLLVALPLQREQFIQDLDAACEADFVKHFSKGRERLSVSGLWNLYEPYVSLILDVIKDVSRCGVEVTCGLKLRDFYDCLPLREVTTLVAHWRSPLFRAGDVAGAVRMAQVVDKRLLALTGVSCKDVGVEELAEKLNVFLQDGRGLETPGDSGRVGSLTRRLSMWHEKRRRIEAELPQVFKGGSSIEFADGLFTIDKIVADVSPDFRGILDLTVCNSVLFGDAIRKKCDHAVVIVNEQSSSLDFRFAAYRQIIRSLARAPRSYIDANLDFRKKLAGVLHEEA